MCVVIVNVEQKVSWKTNFCYAVIKDFFTYDISFCF